MPSTPLTESSVHLDLNDELTIVKESTLSRVLVNNSLLRVVHFTFDTGQVLTEHTTPRAVVCHLTEGEMAWTVNGDAYDLTAGDVVYLAPGTPHALRATAPSRLALTMVDPDGSPSDD